MLVRLVGVRPAISRELIVPAQANLGWVHSVIQLAMGWTNSHLHQFKVGRKVISDPEFELDDQIGAPRVLDEMEVTLDQAVDGPARVFKYEYDFGDSWNHSIRARRLEEGAATARRAVCKAGQGACPPEDCGGTSGYQQLVEALKRPGGRKHAEVIRWLGRPFDPAAFSLEETNQWLARLPWPYVSEEALRKIILERLGIEG